MSKLLTIFIPSYNRAADLRRALDSIYESIEAGACEAEVDILVVDDYSTEDVASIAAIYRERTPGLVFKVHDKKCGVAEAAMLRGLQYVDTPYVWIVGNDDQVTNGSIRYALEILVSNKPSFCLFNFVAQRRGNEIHYETIASVSDVIIFENGECFFMNFGLVTSTTTFPCLCFEVAPLLEVDLERLLTTSPIYSHTAAFYIAYFRRRCCFVNRVMAVFNHNEAIDEHHKLTSHNERVGRIPFYNWTIGLIRHIEYMAAATGVTVETLSLMSEDESRKDTHDVKQTLLVYFIVQNFINQMAQEVRAARVDYCTTIHLASEDMEDCEHFLLRCRAFDLLCFFKRAKTILANGTLLAHERLCLLHGIAKDIEEAEETRIAALDEERRAACDVPGNSREIMVRHANSGYKWVDGVGLSRAVGFVAPVRIDLGLTIRSGAAARPNAGWEELSVGSISSRYVGADEGTTPCSVRTIASCARPDIMIFNHAMSRSLFSQTFGDAPSGVKDRSASEICWWRTDLSLEDVCAKTVSNRAIEAFAGSALLSQPDVSLAAPLRILFINHPSK